MDDVAHYECDLYVEDDRAQAVLIEILAAHNRDIVQRCQLIPFGAATVGQALGQMVAGKRFTRPSCVFLDGDRGPAVGCILLPGDDAPERVVFDELRERAWSKVHERTGRSYADVADACNKAMALADHHEWVRFAASQLVLSGDTLWQAMCAEWATECLPPEDAAFITQPVADALIGVGDFASTTRGLAPAPAPSRAQEEQEAATATPAPAVPIGRRPLF
jgi:hypothetical protein